MRAWSGRLRAGLVLAALLALVLALGLALSRRAISPSQSPGASVAWTLAAPSAEEEGHPVFEYPVPSRVLPELSEPSPAPSGRRRAPVSPPAGAELPPAPRRPVTPPSAAGAPAPGQPPAGNGSQAGGATSTESSPGEAAPETGVAAESTLAPPNTSGLPTPEGGGLVPTTPPPAPVLRPPIPLDQPPLHPLLQTQVLPGPGGGSALGEAAVRGRVRVRLLILADGSVASATVVIFSGDPALDAAARRGLLRWRFSPATRDGVAIDAYLLLWVTFSTE